MVKRKLGVSVNKSGSGAPPESQEPASAEWHFSTPSRARAIGCLAQMAMIYREILSSELERPKRLPERIEWLEAEIKRIVLQGKNLRVDDAPQIFEIYEDYKTLRKL